MAGKDGKIDAGEAAPRKSNKLIVLGLALVLGIVLAGGGAVIYALMAPKATAEKKKEDPEPIFLPLDSFTVNLKGANERFAQVTVTVAIIDPKAVEPIKARMPILRDRVLRSIGKKSAEELLAADGKEKLAADILGAIKESLPEPLRKSVKDVLFSGLIVQ